MNSRDGLPLLSSDGIKGVQHRTGLLVVLGNCLVLGSSLGLHTEPWPESQFLVLPWLLMLSSLNLLFLSFFPTCLSRLSQASLELILLRTSASRIVRMTGIFYYSHAGFVVVV